MGGTFIRLIWYILLQSLLSPMGPPTQLPRSTHKGLLGRKYQDAVAAEEARAKQVSLALVFIMEND